MGFWINASFAMFPRPLDSKTLPRVPLFWISGGGGRRHVGDTSTASHSQIFPNVRSRPATLLTPFTGAHHQTKAYTSNRASPPREFCRELGGPSANERWPGERNHCARRAFCLPCWMESLAYHRKTSATAVPGRVLLSRCGSPLECRTCGTGIEATMRGRPAGTVGPQRNSAFCPRFDVRRTAKPTRR